MTLDKEIAEAMAEKAEWKGDPDALWQKIEARISAPEAQPKNKRSAWRAPAWAAAAASVALVVALWATSSGEKLEMNQAQITPGVQTETTKPQPFNPAEANKEPSITRGPAHTYLGFGVDVLQKEIQPGAPLPLHFRFQGGTDSPVTILEDPRLLILPLAAPYDGDHPESAQGAAVGEVTVPGLKGKTVAARQEVSADVTWNSAQVPPGWYRVVLTPLSTQLDGKVNQMAQGGDERFLITYPAGALRLGATLTVDQVDFTERSTKITYHLDAKAPDRVSVSLTRPEGTVPQDSPSSSQPSPAVPALPSPSRRSAPT
jgi:hypothetical protein